LLIVNNITIFGPAHSGKSTLCGYIKYKVDMSDSEFSHFLEATKRELGSRFESDKIFSYLVDTHSDERNPQPDPDQGTTIYAKYMHLKRGPLNNLEMTIIDTPGAQHNRQDRLKGISFGDFGIFVISPQKLLDLDSMPLNRVNMEKIIKIFDPLYNWVKLKGKDRLIVVLSKMDKVYFAQDIFFKASKIMKTFSCATSIKIIPYSIDVNNKHDHNVFQKSDNLIWYEGQTVFDIIDEFNSNVGNCQNAEKQLFMYIDRRFSKVIGSGSVFQGKIFQGEMSTDSFVKISPLINDEKELVRVSAKIKNIQYNHVDVKYASKGDIVGIDISDVKVEGKLGDIIGTNSSSKLKGKSTRKKDLRTTETSCVFDLNSHIIDGNILIFEVDQNKLKSLSVASQIVVLWFGKLISCNILNKIRLEKTGIITVTLIKYLYVSLPINEKNDFLFTDFLLERKVSVKGNRHLDTNAHYIKSSLKAIGFLKNFSFNFIGLSSKINTISNSFKNFNYEIKGDTIEFRENNLNPVIIAIKKIIDAEHFSDDQYNIKVELETNKV
jgi:translation elongation factor EF-1alpha